MTYRRLCRSSINADNGAQKIAVCGLRHLALGAVAFLATSVGRAEEAAPLGRLDCAPYRVAVTVSFAPDSTVTPVFRQQVIAALSSRIVQVFGAPWSLRPAGSVYEEVRLVPADEIGLDRLTFDSAAALLNGVNCDKAYFLTVELRGRTWQVNGREWDQTLQSLGPVCRETTVDRRGIADSAVRLLSRIFTPLLTVDDADRNSQTATLTIRAGSIPFGDSELAPLKKGSLLRAVFRFLTAKRELRQIVPLGWTYLVVEDIQQGRAKCKIVTSYRAPLAANMRRRVEAVASLVHPNYPNTRLRLLTGRNVHRPLGGLFVTVDSVDAEKPTNQQAAAKNNPGANKLGQEMDRKNDNAAKAKAPPLMSDRRGIVSIHADPDRPLKMITVHSGTAVLARRPLVPGVDADADLELFDDSLRLNTEREIDLLRGELIETVAQRAAFIGRTRAAFKKNDDATVRKLFAHLQKLPNAEAYANELNKIRVLALEENERRRDKISERRINDLYERTLQLITQYLSDDRIQTFKEELSVVLGDDKTKTDLKSGPRSKTATFTTRSRGNTAPSGTSGARSTGSNGEKPAVKRFSTARQKNAAPPSIPVPTPKSGTGI